MYSSCSRKKNYLKLKRGKINLRDRGKIKLRIENPLTQNFIIHALTVLSSPGYPWISDCPVLALKVAKIARLP